MKLAYERPVMRAEMYQTSAYCSICDDNPVLPGGKIDTTGSNLTWYQVPKYNEDFDGAQSYNPNDGTAAGYDMSLIFSDPKTPQTSGTTGEAQYYWTATGDDNSKYYLEYSTGWTEKNDRGDDAGDSVFVLYKETNGTDKLQINWGNLLMPWLSFPGSENDGPNVDYHNRFDDAIAAFTIGKSVAFS